MSHEPWWASRRSDPFIAIAYLAVSLLGAWRIPVGQADHHADALATAACVAGAAGLALRHVSPQAMLALATIGVTVYGVRSYPGGPAYLALPLAIFLFGSQRSRKETYSAAALMAAILLGGFLWASRSMESASLLGVVGWAGASALLADVVRSRQESRRAVRRERREQEQRAQAQEQLWLSRDLHDSVAHALTAIHVQSAIAARQVHSDPDRAEESLEAIRRTTSEALDELGTIVRSLRARGEAPLTPASSLEDIDAVVDQARRSGLHVALDLDVEQPPSRSAVAVAAYRVVQEALTNVLRHAPGAPASVTVRGRSGEPFVVRVTNSAPASTPHRPHSTGLGLVGMRERVEGSGGTLEHGAAADGGYRVEARWEAP